jgi:hypothetical protein
LSELHVQLNVHWGFTLSRLRAFFAGILLAVVAFASVNGIAYAATGSGLILGHHNSANKTTTLKRTTAGPALALHVKAHHAPFTVNSNTQVPKLNASSVDGLHASALQTHDLQFTVPASSTQVATATYSLPTVPPGTYYASFNVVAHMGTAGSLVNCVLEQTNLTTELLGYGAPFIGFSTVSAGGVVTVSTGHPLELRCFTNTGTYATSTSSRSIVDFVKIDSATIQDATVAAIAHARVHHHAHRNATGR